MKLNIKYLPVSELKTYPNNAKIHTAEQIEQIKASIKQFGFNDPIAIWKNNEVIEGHGRLISAIELGLESVPVICLDEMDDKSRKAYMLVHNKLTIDTGFNYDLLQIELSRIDIDMKQFGFELQPDDDVEYVETGKEFDVNDFNDEQFEYECPECGFRFNS